MNRAMDTSTTTEELWKTLISTEKETCGMKLLGEHKKRTSWRNESIKEQVKIKKQRWKEYLQKRTKESYINCKIQRKKVKNMVLNTKKQIWAEFQEKMEKASKRNQKNF